MDRLVDGLRVLVVGFGSIGSRHAANLLAREDVAAVTAVSRRPVPEDVLGDPRLAFVSSMEDARADAAIVATETDRHVSDAEELLSRGIPVLVEKPLSHEPEGARRLAVLAEERGVPAFVAYNMRLLPVLGWARDILSEGVLGPLCYARIEVGQHLSQWRPGREHRRTYSAGPFGGVALDLSHEVDYMRFLFGEPEEWRVMTSHVGGLGIERESVFEGVYRLPGDALCTVHLDYLEPRLRRGLRVVGECGTLEVDIAAGVARLDAEERAEEVTDAAMFDVAATYRDELAVFLSAARGGDAVGLATLEDGVRAVELTREAA